MSACGAQTMRVSTYYTTTGYNSMLQCSSFGGVSQDGTQFWNKYWDEPGGIGAERGPYNGGTSMDTPLYVRVFKDYL